MAIESFNNMDFTRNIVCSVVMTTYNGRLFLSEQLESLMHQKLPPEEIVIADDCSSDESFALARAFAETHPEIEWNVYRNTHNLGWKRNFKEAISKARGQLIYLCDQDDVWLPDHISSLAECMETHPEMDLITSGLELLVEADSFVKQSSALEEKTQGTGMVSSIPCDKTYLNVEWPGCTYCVRQSLVKEVSPFWEDDFPHDAMLYCAANVKGTLGHLDEPTLRFRRHSGNASDERTIDSAARKELIKYYRKMNASLLAFYNSLPPERRQLINESGAIQTVREVDAFEATRMAFLENATPSNVIRLLAKRDMYVTKRALFADFACAFFPKHQWQR